MKNAVHLVCEPDATSIYLPGPRGLEFHRCKVCGLTTHWVNVDRMRPRMGVNARLMPREVRAKARVAQGSGPGSWTRVVDQGKPRQMTSPVANRPSLMIATRPSARFYGNRVSIEPLQPRVIK
jgi:hypothetical protein